MTPAQLKRLQADARDFDPDLDSIRCDVCWHLWRLVWMPDRMELHPAAPVGWVIEEKACADCAARIRKWNRKHGNADGPVRRTNEVPESRTGLVVTGLNG